MQTSIQVNNKTYQLDMSQPLDISIPLRGGENNLTAWYVDPPRFETVMANGFVGDVNLGGATNFRNIFFNPHGHGTHTECVGHISKENYTINQCLKQFFFIAEVVSLAPQKIGKDLVVQSKTLNIHF